MRTQNIFTGGLVSLISAIVILAGTSIVLAQDSPRDEYEEWQSARRELLNEQREYQRNPTRSNYRGWQEAIRDEQRERAEYQRALARYGRNWNPQYNERGTYVVNSSAYPRNTYRIYTNGQYYNVDNRGYSMLREAVNRGYQQGYRAGMNDRQYRRSSNFYNNSIYRSGTFGYNSYVARNQYQHYFQQGFQRGYEDGFNRQTRYGYRTGNTYNILGGVLNTILNIAGAVDDDYR